MVVMMLKVVMLVDLICGHDNDSDNNSVMLIITGFAVYQLFGTLTDVRLIAVALIKSRMRLLIEPI